jgi:hypothetical protein
MVAREQALERRLAQTLAAAGRRAAEAIRNGESIDDATAGLNDDLVRVLAPSLAETARTFGARLISGPKSWAFGHGPDLQRKAFEDLDAAIRRHIWAGTARRVVGVSGTLRETIRRIVREGLADNLGQEEIARRIVEATGEQIAMDRARRIARTEVHNAAMYGQQAAAEASPLAFEKVWLATEDARTRKSHADANGQRVALDQPFVLQTPRGAVRLMFPGDPEAPAGETINCRCTVMYEPLPVMKDPAAPDRVEPDIGPVDVDPGELDEIDPEGADNRPPASPDIDREPVFEPVDLPGPEPVPEARDPVPEPLPEALPEPLPERDLEAQPYERQASTVYAAGPTLSLSVDGTPATGSTVQIIGPNAFYYSPDSPEVDRVIAANPDFLGFRRPVLWEVSIPAGAAYPRNLVEEAGAGVIINSGVGRYGLVNLRVTAVRKVRWGEAAPKDYIDPATDLDPFVRAQIERTLSRMQGLDPDLGTPSTDRDTRTAREIANFLAAQIQGVRRLDSSVADPSVAAPEAVVRALYDTAWTRASLATYLEQLLAGDIRDEPETGEPDVHARVIVVEATADFRSAIPRE